MDLATILGIVIGMGLVIFTILSGSGSAMIFVHFPSMAVVFGGAIAATLVHTPLGEVVSAMKVVGNAFKVEPAKEPEIIDQFVDLAKKARRWVKWICKMARDSVRVWPEIWREYWTREKLKETVVDTDENGRVRDPTPYLRLISEIADMVTP